MNLLQETKDAIKKSGHYIKDVQFVGSSCSTYCCNWKKFCKIADQDYHCLHVAFDLVIVFDDNTWLERSECDGAKWWAFRQCPVVPLRSEQKVIQRVFGQSLRKLHNE